MRQGFASKPQTDRAPPCAPESIELFLPRADFSEKNSKKAVDLVPLELNLDVN